LAEVTFGEWLNRQRGARGWTQEQLAIQLSCSLGALRKFESEERFPSPDVVERLAEIFNVPQAERKSFLRYARGDWQAIADVGYEEAPWRGAGLTETIRSSAPSGTVTFLFTDIEGSTKLARAHPEAWEAARARHHAILQSAMNANKGYVFQIIGDAFCATFHKTGDALKAATKAQHDLQTETWGDVKIRVRMGIHTGEAEIQSDGQYHGYLALSLVQRIMSAGHGGQILISGATENLLRGQLSDGVDLHDMGRHNFKDAPQPVRVFQVNISGLQRDFPPLRTFDIHPNNLPAQLTSFVGREKELADVKRLLADTHMLTLIGPGGTGKTRLSVRLARDVLNEYPDGIWMIDLAPVLDPTLVPRTTAITIGLRDEPQRPVIDMLCDYLSTKQMLIILDNCEHLVEACANMAEQILRTAADVRILASSREALGVAGEVTYRVPSLGLPDVNNLPSIESLSQYEAVKLFIDRATSAVPNFKVTNETAPSLAQVCQRLDGIPLAIELAAAKIRVLSLEQIAKRLDDRFRLLTGGRRTALERHQTLRAAVDWSYNLLPPEEQTLFRRLSVFVGGWTLEAAESVCGNESSPGVVGDEDVLNLLEQLINKSLVITEEEQRESRYRMLETMRQYASEKLVESGESDQLHSQHLRFFMELAETAEPHLRRAEQLEWLSLLDTEHENLRTALNWSLDIPLSLSGLRLASAMGPYWEVREHWRDGIKWLQALLQKDGKVESPKELSVRGKALLCFVELLDNTDDVEQMLPAAEEAFKIYENLNDSHYKALAYALLGQATGRIYRDPNGTEHQHAIQLLEQSREMFKKMNDSWGQAFTLEPLGLFYDDGTRETELIDPIYRDMETLSLASGDRYRIAQSFSRIADWYLSKNDLDHVDPLIVKANGYYQELGIQVLPLTYWTRMLVYLLNEKHDQAKSLFQNMDRKLEVVGNRNQRMIGYIVLSLFALDENQPDVIIDLGLKIMEIREANQHKGFTAQQNMILGAGYYLKGDRKLANENIHSSLDLITELQDRKSGLIAFTLQNFSLIVSLKDMLGPSRLLGAIYAYHQSFSTDPFEPYFRRKVSKIIKAQIGEDEFNAAFAEGEKMSIQEAIEFAKSLVEKL